MYDPSTPGGPYFKNKKPNGIIAEDFYFAMKWLKKEHNANIYLMHSYPEDLPDDLIGYNQLRPYNEFYFSQFDEIVISCSNLSVYGEVLANHFIGFLNGLKTFNGKCSCFFTDTTLPKCSIFSKFLHRITNTNSGIELYKTIENDLPLDLLNLGIDFEKNIDTCYTPFLKPSNKFTKQYSNVIGINTWCSTLLEHRPPILEVEHSQLIPKGCYIGNYKAKRVKRLKQLGLYNDQSIVEYYGKISRDLECLEDYRIARLGELSNISSKYLAQICVCDPEMDDLGIPHRLLQSLSIGMPVLIANTFNDYHNWFKSPILNKFSFFKDGNAVIKRLELLKNRDFFNEIIRLQQEELKIILIENQ